MSENNLFSSLSRCSFRRVAWDGARLAVAHVRGNHHSLFPHDKGKQPLGERRIEFGNFPSWHGLNAFWTALTASKPTLVQSFQADPFRQCNAEALAVKVAAITPHFPAGWHGRERSKQTVLRAQQSTILQRRGRRGDTVLGAPV